MKKFLVLSFLILAAASVWAQDVDNFYVGPYEVEYRGEGDYKFRLSKDVDLYKYFNLKRDTVINVSKEKTAPIKSAWMVEGRIGIPRFIAAGCSNVFGIDAGWKYRIGNGVYAGISAMAALSTGKYLRGSDSKSGAYHELDESFFEIGLPLSIELTNLDRKKASLYGSIGVMPAFYFGAKGMTDDDDKQSGLLVSPQLGVGGYVPITGLVVRIGLFAQYDINCSKDEFDIFKDRIGRFSLGGNIGVVF